MLKTPYIRTQGPLNIYNLRDQSDRDKDGQLSYDEFTTAVQLVNQARSATNQAIGMSTMRGKVNSTFTAPG